MILSTSTRALTFFLLALTGFAHAQPATINEAQRTLLTYPFDDPNPVPVLTDNPKIYPYFKYEGYSHQGVEKEWKVVTLENEYIQVFVLPEAGGKVWGAIEKSTGEKFIYRNEVMKFRNIAMRGPWTSGGIEFNFGIIGHTPSTATPVDYLLRTNEDGSVTCVVGNMDLPSRNHWRVFITLPKDKAYFETRVVWYNPTPFNHPYYNWMTAAAATGDDLEFFIPGDQYLTHPGQAKSWPHDGERKISDYRRNDYGPSKSYHIVGSYDDYFGGYFHDSEFGFGHWARYDDMPGQKLWLWALSRSGGIWEDLLTDTDGQYIEFQAGRQFNQYSQGADLNPITKMPFEPYRTDEWSEIWFPVKGIGGLTEVSKEGVLHITRNADVLEIGINALQAVGGTLTIKADGETVLEEKMESQPMSVHQKTVTLPRGSGTYTVDIPEMNLSYTASPSSKAIKRPFASFNASDENSAQAKYDAGMELIEDRDFTKGEALLREALAIDPRHTSSHLALAELMLRRAQHDDALRQVNEVLSWDTYEPEANFIAGTIYRAQGDWVNALESFGWSARSMEFRSASYTQMAEVQLQQASFGDAKHYAGRALDYNQYNINALKALAVALRKLNQEKAAIEVLRRLLDIDPLNHFARHERSLLSESDTPWDQYITNELPAQTYLELAIDYFSLGQISESGAILKAAPDEPIVQLWAAYLSQSLGENFNDHLDKVLEMPTAFAFPYRQETIPALQWAMEQNEHWKLKYYLALALWSKDRVKEAHQLLEQCEAAPDEYHFYMARSHVREQLGAIGVLEDLLQATELAPSDWRPRDELIAYYQKNGQHAKSLATSAQAFKSFPGNNSIAFKYVSALLTNEQPQKAEKILNELQVLPFEGASEGRQLYENTLLMLAAQSLNKGNTKRAMAYLNKAREWPENLGVGKPYDSDNRAIDYFTAKVYAQNGDRAKADQFFKSVLTYKGRPTGHPNYLLQLRAAKETASQEALQDLKDQGRAAGDPRSLWALQVVDGAASGEDTESVRMKVLRLIE